MMMLLGMCARNEFACNCLFFTLIKWETSFHKTVLAKKIKIEADGKSNIKGQINS